MISKCCGCGWFYFSLFRSHLHRRGHLNGKSFLDFNPITCIQHRSTNISFKQKLFILSRCACKSNNICICLIYERLAQQRNKKNIYEIITCYYLLCWYSCSYNKRSKYKLILIWFVFFFLFSFVKLSFEHVFFMKWNYL